MNKQTNKQTNKHLSTLLCFLFLIVGISKANSQLNYTDFNWVKTFGGPKNDYANKTITDVFGNVLVIGTVYGTAQFGNVTIQPLGSYDNFIAKYNPNGGLIWVKVLTNELDGDAIKSFISDTSGNIYLSGTYENTFDLDPGEEKFLVTSKGQADNFLIKLDINGNFIWGKSFGNTEYDDNSSLIIDRNNHLYLTGYFKGTLDFGLGGTPYFLTANKGTDVFVMKINSSGNLLWAKSFEGTGFEHSASLAVDKNFNLYISGKIANAKIDLDPGEGVYEVTSNAANNGGNFFLVKLNAQGNFVKGGITARTNQDPAQITIVDMKTDSQDNLYLTGNWYGSINFDLTGGSQVYSSLYASNANTFVMKINPDLEFQWNNPVNSYVTVRAHSFSIDKNDVIYMTGNADGNTTFSGNKLDTCFCTFDVKGAAFISTLNSSGYWTNLYGFNADSRAFGSNDASGNYYLGGNFKYSLRFSEDLNGSLFNLPNPDQDFEQGFVMKIGNHPLVPLANYPPVANNDQVQAKQNESTTFNVINNDTDAENNIDPSSTMVITHPKYGTLTNNHDGTFTYLHNGSQNLTDFFRYTVSDTGGLVSNVATVNIEVIPNLATNNHELKSNINIYPNPASSLLYVNAPFKQLEIYDSAGRKVLTSKSNPTHIKQLSKGIYWIKLELMSNSYKTIKLIKK